MRLPPDKVPPTLADNAAVVPQDPVEEISRLLFGIAVALIPVIYGLICLDRGWMPVLARRSLRVVLLDGNDCITFASIYIASGLHLHVLYFWGVKSWLHRFRFYPQAFAFLALILGCIEILWWVLK